MVHLDSTFNSSQYTSSEGDDDYIDEGVQFEYWSDQFESKNYLKEPMMMKMNCSKETDPSTCSSVQNFPDSGPGSYLSPRD